MPDIYEILSKHFLNETSKKEEVQIVKFKSEHPTECRMLRKLWNRGDIKTKDFNSAKAWVTMQQKIKDKPQPRVIKISAYKHILRIAAVAAILIIGTFSVYYFTSVLPGSQVITASANSTERGKQVTLSDGTIVWLNRGATLSYKKKFVGDERAVTLTGEAFFKVFRNPEKPFVITTNNAAVKVLGTSFNVKSSADNTKVVVKTGKVRVSNNKESDSQIITPGLSAEVSEEKVTKYKTKNRNYLAWKTGEFIFNNTPLHQVIEDLNTWYDNKIVLKATNEINCRLTANFKKAEIENIIETIRLTCDVKILKDKEQYFITQ